MSATLLFNLDRYDVARTAIDCLSRTGTLGTDLEWLLDDNPIPTIHPHERPGHAGNSQLAVGA